MPEEKHRMLRKTNRFILTAFPPRSARILGGAPSRSARILGGAPSRHAENESRFARRDANGFF